MNCHDQINHPINRESGALRYLRVARISLIMAGFGLILTGIVSAGIPLHQFMKANHGQYDYSRNDARFDQISASLDEYRAALKLK